MKKKIILVIAVLIIIISWFFYTSPKLISEKIVETNNDTKVIAPDSQIPPSLKISNSTALPTKDSVEKKNYRIKESKDEKFEAFDKLEKAWLNKAQEIIGAENYPLYVEMRNQNDKEKMQAYKEYHDYLRQKYGDKFSYNITDDQSAREKQINQRYLNNLLKLIGPTKFKNYTSSKDQFNEEMRRNNKESIQIEF